MTPGSLLDFWFDSGRVPESASWDDMESDLKRLVTAAVAAEREALLPPLVELYAILEGDDDPSEERIQTACDTAAAAIRARAGDGDTDAGA